MKKLLAFLLCAVLIIPAAASVADDAPIKWSGTISVASYMFAPFDPDKDIVVGEVEKILKEKYGYDVTFDVVYVEYPQYQEIINTRIAGKTAPDVFISLNQTNMDTLYDQGALATWDVEFFQENAPNLYAFFNGGGYHGRLANFVDMFWDYSTVDDGKMVTVAGMTEAGSMPYKTLIYRGDFLDALGVDPANLPMTVEDFMDLMYKMALDDPDGNGVKDTYGFSTTAIEALFGAYGSYTAISSGFSQSPSWGPHWFVGDDGKAICSDILPANKDVLALLQQAYADGVLDPEFITGENTGGYWAISQGFINGLYGVSALASIDHYRLPEVVGDDGGRCAQEYYAVNGTDAKFYYGPWPAGPNGDYGWRVGYAVGIGENMIYNASLNDDPEKMAAILAIMDIFNTDDELAILASYGVEGVTFEYNDVGSVTMLVTNEEMNEVGVAVLRGVYGGGQCYNDTVLELGFYNNPTIKNRLDWFEVPQYNSYLITAVPVSLPSQSTYASELLAYRDETWISIIKGDLDVDYYDEYVQTWKDLGGDILTQEANDWLAAN
ncbi:MAG: extracellular solute-binding protein [Clostridiales bacterium]|nr:extracellular solute-binding protein [Clostridiales bacterium]